MPLFPFFLDSQHHFCKLVLLSERSETRVMKVMWLVVTLIFGILSYILLLYWQEKIVKQLRIMRKNNFNFRKLRQNNFNKDDKLKSSKRERKQLLTDDQCNSFFFTVYPHRHQHTWGQFLQLFCMHLQLLHPAQGNSGR
jgi:hypothetical protein